MAWRCQSISPGYETKETYNYTTIAINRIKFCVDTSPTYQAGTASEQHKLLCLAWSDTQKPLHHLARLFPSCRPGCQHQQRRDSQRQVQQQQGHSQDQVCRGQNEDGQEPRLWMWRWDCVFVEVERNGAERQNCCSCSSFPIGMTIRVGGDRTS